MQDAAVILFFVSNVCGNRCNNFCMGGAHKISDVRDVDRCHITSQTGAGRGPGGDLVIKIN